MAEAGLCVIFDPIKDSPAQCHAEIDVVAVHGLNFMNNPDHARDTWAKGGKLWLKDFLPDKLAKPARVMLFSYNSNPTMGAAAIKLDDHANILLHWLNLKRQDASQRPLLFICHSLGGLLVKQALVEATLDNTYKPIVEATKLLIFFATPHRGGRYASVGDIAAKIVRAGLRKPTNDLFESLKKQSDSATKRFEQSRHLYERCLVVNFYEGEPYGTLGIIVDKDSATLGLPGTREKQVAMHADHSSICKFELVNTACELVLETIAMETIRALDIEPRNVHWSVPRSINPMFTGRLDIIRRVKNAMKLPSQDIQSIFVLTGMGGLGKSEVCLKVANDLREEFWGVFWVDVSSDSAAKEGFSTVAKRLGSIETDIDEARRLLSNISAKCPWLLILDNADNPDIDYQKYCPSGTRGKVLITSRNHECQTYATVGCEELSGLGKDDCVYLLVQAARLHLNSQETRLAAEAVTSILGSHTLAILHAGAYIARGRTSLTDYPAVFETQRAQLLQFSPKQAQSRYRNVYATLEASAQTLENLDSEESVQDALCLLQLLSAFHYQGVPLE
ncbi:hypothetical protein GQX73_g10961 [Xylaria multiplex]|uniref:NB-ARC domain-containing protein n=1 Tax=Xylaria multiplex TaxID=323545 RepID=A0A7C8MEQ3_9PEZI|nr:hypothetical protein GQX73_g10961 [Xylaria multiplex]